MTPTSVMARFHLAKAQRSSWESLWRDCYAYSLPSRDDAPFAAAASLSSPNRDRLFDGTAPDAVDQLAASLLAELTPPWARWFGFAPGREIPEHLHGDLSPKLERAAEIMQQHFDRSNFAVEIHQCFLDLVVSGTACLSFEETATGQASAFRFAAVPLWDVVLEEGADGRLDIAYRRNRLSRLQLQARFPGAEIPSSLSHETDRLYTVIEAVVPRDTGSGYDYCAVLEGGGEKSSEPLLLAHTRLDQSPFLSFRWMKAPGEAYGRSPVMKALPDIKTANKVVELTLKNAAIAVTGIWQADDDGVLNPATVKLVPGTIIPKAVGSSGLTPLQAPGNFNVSDLTLATLRQAIRSSLLTDRLATVATPGMTATEVLHRAAETARLLGATYGRLQAELLTPLVARALTILSRRGELPNLALDGRTITLQYRSPLARRQAQLEAQGALSWLDIAKQLGPDAAAILDAPKAARWAAKMLDLPASLLRPDFPLVDVSSTDASPNEISPALVTPPHAPSIKG
jgi:hypothetical protein